MGNLPRREFDLSLVNSIHTLHLKIGDTCCAIRCPDHAIFHFLYGQYNNFISDAPADLSIELDIVDQLSKTKIETIIKKLTPYNEDGLLTTSNVAFISEFDPINHNLKATLERNLFSLEHEGHKFMNRVLPAAYFTACGIAQGKRPPAMAVHACSIIRHGQTLIFTGPSGAGKTTIARFCGNSHGNVINDEMVLVSWPDKNNHPPRVHGIPIIGGISQRLNTTAPLGCVVMLKKSKRTTFRRLDRMESYLRFMRQVVAPVSFEDGMGKRSLLALTTGFTHELVRNTVFYELEFNLDSELLWEVVGKLEASLGGGPTIWKE